MGRTLTINNPINNPTNNPIPPENSPTLDSGPLPPSEQTVLLEGPGSTLGLASQKPTKEFKLPPFPTIPGFHIHGELGRGAMGVVYEATQNNLNRLVAIKLLLIDSPDLIKRFQLEANALGRIHHEGILEIYDVGFSGERPFLVTELMKGGTLNKATAGLQVDSRDAASLALQMSRALAATHAVGILHRDLKPGNVMLVAPPPKPDANGLIRLGGVQVKLCDFGLAKDIDDSSQHMTQTGVVMGTPGYMAPEQAMGNQRDLGPPTDIFALGAILYELLTGRPPFRGETQLETIRMTAERDPVALSKMRAGIPIDLETICLKCLHKHPARRYTTALDLALDLEAFLANKPIKARRTSQWERSWKWCARNPTLAASMGFILTGLMIALLLAYLATQSRFQRDNQNLASLQKNLGFERLRDNDLTKAAIWFAASLSRETRPELRAIDRLRLGALMDGFPWIRSYVVHDRAVQGAEWSPSGRLYLCYGDDRAIRIQDPTQFPPTVAELVLPRGPLDLGVRILSARFLDESRVLALDEDGQLFEWHWLQQKQQKQPKKIGDGFTAFAVDSTKGFFALAREDKVYIDFGKMASLDSWATLKPIAFGGGRPIELLFMADHLGLVVRTKTSIVRLAPDGKTLPMTGIEGPITCLAKCPQGKNLAAANALGDVRIWLNGQTLPEKLSLSHPVKVLCLAFSPDGKYLASGAIDQRVSVNELSSGLLKYQVFHDGEVTCLAFSPTETLLYTGACDNTVRIWHSNSGKNASSKLVYNATIRTIVPHPTAPLLLAGGDDNVCCLWDTAQKNRIQFFLEGPTDQFEIDGSDLLALRQGETVRVGSTTPLAKAMAPSDRLSRVVPFDTKSYVNSLVTLPVRAKQISLMGKDKVLVLEGDGAVSYWDQRGKLLGPLLPPQAARAEATAIVSDPSGTYFVIETANAGLKKIHLFNADGGAIALNDTAKIQAWAFGPDPGVLAWGDRDGFLRIAHLTGFNVRMAGPVKAHSGGVTAIAISEGKVVTGGEDMRIRLWSATNPTTPLFPEHKEPQHASAVGTISFTPSGTQFLTGSEDNTLRLWDTLTGESSSEAMLHGSSVLHIKSFPPGSSAWKIAATRSSEGAIYQWDLTHGQLIAPLLVPPGYSVRGFAFLDTGGTNPVLILGGSKGSIIVQKLMEAPPFATDKDLLAFAEYHPAFTINKDATDLVPIPGSEILPRMKAVWSTFAPMFPPLSSPFQTPLNPQGKQR